MVFVSLTTMPELAMAPALGHVPPQLRAEGVSRLCPLGVLPACCDSPPPAYPVCPTTPSPSCSCQREPSCVMCPHLGEGILQGRSGPSPENH